MTLAQVRSFAGVGVEVGVGVGKRMRRDVGIEAADTPTLTK